MSETATHRAAKFITAPPRQERERWREDAERQRTASGHIYGEPARILMLLDALDEAERVCVALDRDGSQWRRATLAPTSAAVLSVLGAPR